MRIMKHTLYNNQLKAWSIFTLTMLLFVSTYGSAYAQESPEAFAGDDFTACENEVAVSGTALNYETVLWTSSGDGEFVSSNTLVSTYLPGPSDISTGQAELCLTAFGGGNESTDCLIATIIAAPTFDLGVEQATICYNEIYTFAEAQGSNYSLIQWFTTNGGGFFDNENTQNPSYFPSPVIDYAQGCVTIGFLAVGNDPCTISVEDEMELCFEPDAQVDLGGDTHYACYDENYTFSEATASGTSFIQWTPLNGSGYFENANSINATYVPDPELDYPQGCIYVILIAGSNSPCTTSIEEYIAICFQPSPEVDAGADGTVTNSESFACNATTLNDDSRLWESSGDGTFEDATAASTNYFPGNLDRQNGMVTLTISAYNMANCPAASDQLSLTINSVQSIEIPEGTGGFSSFVNAQGLSFEELIAPISDKVIFAQNMTQVYWPEHGINTMNDFINSMGYKIILSSSAILPLEGTANSAIIDLPEGWSILPINTSCNVGFQEFIDQLGTDLIIITEIEGDKIIWPDGNVFTLNELTPGNAYMIKLENTSQFEFPACQ
jgi:hypothetical protein